MTKIITAIGNPKLNEEIKKERNIQIICKDIPYKEGILEILEKEIEIDYIIIDEKLPGEISLGNLIEKIIEINEKIKIIITVKKENKNNINFNNKKIIKILYENEINLNKLKNNKNNSEKIKKLKIKKLKNINIKKLKYIINKIKKINIEKFKDKRLNKKKFNKLKIKNIIRKDKKNRKMNIKTKIISIIGEERVGKSMTIINFAYYLQSKNCKILLVDLNKDSPNIHTIVGNKKINIKQKNHKKRIIKKYKKYKGRFIKKYINKNIIEKMIIKINKNINLITYNKLINFYLIKKIEKNYDYIFIENNSKKINKKILINSDKKILIIRPNLIGVKNIKKIIEKNKLNKINNIKLIINNYNKYSINEKILKNIFYKNEIIGKIKYNEEYENLINKNFKVLNLKDRNLKMEIKEILNRID